MEISWQLTRLNLVAAGFLLLSAFLSYSLVRGQAAPNITGIYNDSKQGGKLVVDCYNCLGPNRTANSGTLNKKGGGQASVSINPKNPADSGDEGGQIIVPDSLGAKFADYLQLCTSGGCSNYIYNSAGATQTGAIQKNPQTGQYHYVATPPPAELPATPITCTLRLVGNNPNGQSKTNGETLELSNGEPVSAGLIVSPAPPANAGVPKISWDHGEIQDMTKNSENQSEVRYGAVKQQLNVQGYTRVTVIYPFCSNIAEVYVSPAKTPTQGGGSFDCALNLYKGSDNVNGGSINSDDNIVAYLNVSGGSRVSDEAVVWGDLGSPSSIDQVNQDSSSGKISYKFNAKTLTADGDKTISVTLKNSSFCQVAPSVPLKINGGGEKTVRIQVTDIYSSEQDARDHANATNPTWTDNQCGSGFVNLQPRCKVFEVDGGQGGILKLHAEGTSDPGNWTFTPESSGVLCVRYISNKPTRWDLKCTQVFQTTPSQTAVPTRQTPGGGTGGGNGGQNRVCDGIVCNGQCYLLTNCKGLGAHCLTSPVDGFYAQCNSGGGTGGGNGGQNRVCDPNNQTDISGACNSACCTSDAQCGTGGACNIGNGYCRSGRSCGTASRGGVTGSTGKGAGDFQPNGGGGVSAQPAGYHEFCTTAVGCVNPYKCLPSSGDMICQCPAGTQFNSNGNCEKVNPPTDTPDDDRVATKGLGAACTNSLECSGTATVCIHRPEVSDPNLKQCTILSLDEGLP